MNFAGKKYVNRKTALFAVCILSLLFVAYIWIRPMAHVVCGAGDFDTPESVIYLDGLPGIAADPGYYVDNSMELSEGQDTITMRGIDLPAGSYRLHIRYSASDHSNVYSMNSEWMNNSVVNGYQNCGLREGNNMEETVSVFLSHKVDGISAAIRYGGNGYLYVSGVSVEETYLYKILFTFAILCLCLVCAGAMYGGRYLQREDRIVMLVVLGTAFFASLVIFTPFQKPGHDLGFHLNRIEAIAAAIREGDIPNRIGGWWNGGSSYPSAIFYAETFLYVPALLRVIGVSVQNAYKTYQLLINVMTAIVAYVSFHAITKEKKAALISMMLYVLAPYRMICVYLRGAVGEYTAMVFYPLVACALYLIYSASTRKEHEKGVLALILGYTGLIQCHILGTVMAGIFTLIVMVILLKRTLRKAVLLDFFAVGGTAALLNAWFLVPYLTFDKSHLNVFALGTDTYTEQHAVYLGQIFSFFPRGEGSSWRMWEEYPTFNEMSFGMGLGLFAALAIYVIYRVYGEKGTAASKMAAAVAGIAILFSSNLFPWESVGHLSSFAATVINTIQFTWRFLGIMTAALALLGGLVYCLLGKSELRKYKETALVLMVVGALVSAAYFEEAFFTEAPNGLYRETSDLDSYAISDGEYLIAKTDIGGLRDKTVTAEEGLLVTDAVLENGHFTANVQNTSGTDRCLEIPIQSYSGYAAADMAGNSLAFEAGSNNNIRIHIPGNYESSIRVYYPERTLWKLADLISVFTLLAMAAFPIIRKKRNN